MREVFGEVISQIIHNSLTLNNYIYKNGGETGRRPVPQMPRKILDNVTANKGDRVFRLTISAGGAFDFAIADYHRRRAKSKCDIPPTHLDETLLEEFLKTIILTQ